MKISLILSSATLFSLFISCSTHAFFPAPSYTEHLLKEKKCDLKFLPGFPEDNFCYELMGTCKGRGKKGMIKTEYDNAQKMVEECACKMGADVVIISRGTSIGFQEPVGWNSPPTFNPNGSFTSGGFISLGSTFKQTGVEVTAYILSLHKNCPE